MCNPSARWLGRPTSGTAAPPRLCHAKGETVQRINDRRSTATDRRDGRCSSRRRRLAAPVVLATALMGWGFLLASPAGASDPGTTADSGCARSGGVVAGTLQPFETHMQHAHFERSRPVRNNRTRSHAKPVAAGPPRNALVPQRTGDRGRPGRSWWQGSAHSLSHHRRPSPRDRAADLRRWF